MHKDRKYGLKSNKELYIICLVLKYPIMTLLVGDLLIMYGK